MYVYIYIYIHTHTDISLSSAISLLLLLLLLLLVLLLLLLLPLLLLLLPEDPHKSSQATSHGFSQIYFSDCSQARSRGFEAPRESPPGSEAKGILSFFFLLLLVVVIIIIMILIPRAWCAATGRGGCNM